MEDIHHISAALENVLSRLRRVRKSAGSGWSACCPAHHDTNPSLSVGLGKEGRILLKCFAGCSVEQIASALGLAVADLFSSPPSSRQRTRAGHPGITLLDLAQDKLLPWRYLCNLGIIDDPSGGVRIPYYQIDGTPAPRYRLRTALTASEGSRWNKGEGEIVPYGLERLEEERKKGTLILVEGESDAWTLWFHHFPALGIPGAEMSGVLKPEHTGGFERLYLIQEPDAAGASFVRHLVSLLSTWNWPGHAYTVSLPNEKDPNNLHKRDWKTFPATFQQALDQAILVWSPEAPEVPVERAEPEAAPPPDHPATISLQALLKEPFPPSHWVVPDLVPEGLLLLVGKPKQGKSWLALQMALAIVSRGAVFGVYQADQGAVLYLALEDTLRRLQVRTKRLLATQPAASSELDFAIHWPRLDEGGLEQLETYLDVHPHIRLVIIDTWAKVAPHTSTRAHSQYENDYTALAPLKQLADAHRLSILVIHHLRKTPGRDALDEIAGSTGMTGAVDGIFLLKRAREQDEAELLVTGRDIQEHSLPLIFNPTTAQWTYTGTTHDHERKGVAS